MNRFNFNHEDLEILEDAQKNSLKALCRARRCPGDAIEILSNVCWSLSDFLIRVDIQEDFDDEEEEEDCDHDKGDIQHVNLYRKIGKIEGMLESALEDMPCDCVVPGQKINKCLKFLRDNF